MLGCWGAARQQGARARTYDVDLWTEGVCYQLVLVAEEALDNDLQTSHTPVPQLVLLDGQCSAQRLLPAPAGVRTGCTCLMYILAPGLNHCQGHRLVGCFACRVPLASLANHLSWRGGGAMLQTV